MQLTKKQNKRSQEGFTLIEILVVIGIIAILAAVVLIAINPARQFAQANDSQRESNVNAILNAVGQYMADNQGVLPGATSTPPEIPSGDSSDTSATGDYGTISSGDVDICEYLVSEYMPALPVDPTAGDDEPIDTCSSYDTGYKIIQDSTTGRISVFAEGQVKDEIIVTR